MDDLIVHLGCSLTLYLPVNMTCCLFQWSQLCQHWEELRQNRSSILLTALRLPEYSFLLLSCIYPHSAELQAIQLSLLHVTVIYCLLITHRMPSFRSSSAFQRLGNISLHGVTLWVAAFPCPKIYSSPASLSCFIHKSYGHILDLSSLQILNSKVPRNFEVSK